MKMFSIDPEGYRGDSPRILRSASHEWRITERHFYLGLLARKFHR